MCYIAGHDMRCITLINSYQDLINRLDKQPLQLPALEPRQPKQAKQAQQPKQAQQAQQAQQPKPGPGGSGSMLTSTK